MACWRRFKLNATRFIIFNWFFISLWSIFIVWWVNKIIKHTLLWKVVQIAIWPARKLYNYTKSINDALQSPTSIRKAANNDIDYVTKITGATTGACGAAKGGVDAAEALAYQDGICFFVSCVGTTADSLQIMASFVPGPNVTTLVSTPVSWGCKVFV